MNKVDIANKFFDGGFSCSQSVVCAFCEDFGLDTKIALKLSQSFAGGMGQGLVCGAATGAYMVIGLKYGRYIAEDLESKELNMKKILEFNNKFLDVNKELTCNKLLKDDVTTEEGKQRIADSGIKKVVCPKAVESAVKILEEIL